MYENSGYLLKVELQFVHLLICIKLLSMEIQEGMS